MKKIFVISIMILIALVLFIMVYVSKNKLEQVRKSKVTIQNLSSLVKKFNLENINESQVFILVYFNSECDFCKWEIKEIQKNINKFDECKLVLTSHESKDKAIVFLEKYNLDCYYKYIPAELLIETIVGGVPQILIYKRGNLEKHFKGEVKIEAIINVIN